MTLETVDTESLPEGESETLAAILTELQGLKVKLVAGVGAATPITLAGIATDDTLVSVLQFAAGVPSDVTSSTTIPSAGHVQVSTATTGDQLVVIYFHKGS